MTDDVAELPAHLDEVVRRRKRAEHADNVWRRFEGALDKVKGAQEGERDNTLNSQAHFSARLTYIGLDAELARSELRSAGLGIGLTEREVARILDHPTSGWHSGLKAGPMPESPRHPTGNRRVPRLVVHGGVDSIADPSWWDDLDCTKDGKVKGGSNNLKIILTNDQRISGVVAFNMMSQTPYVVKDTPWHGPQRKLPRPLEDHDGAECALWLHREYGKMPAKDRETIDALVYASHRFEYDPVVDYLTSLAWDGKPRINTWLQNVFGCDDTPYISAIGSCWLIGAVARPMQPGCKMDNALTLEGDRGIGKSMTCAALVPVHDWYTGQKSDVEGKDGLIANQGVWIRELAELAGMRKADVDSLKRYMSDPVDRYRGVHEKMTLPRPRRCAYIATVNPVGTGYLKDPTGNRNFWIAPVVKADTQWVIDYRDQLWAEAVVRYRAGEPWWLRGEVESDAADVQSTREEIDPYLEIIDEWLGDSEYAVNKEILSKCLRIEPGRQAVNEAHRVAKCLKKLGFVHEYRTAGERRLYRTPRR